ncbi:CXXC-type zinc finger protein 1-like [Macaca thibetana thibetana]|uniref:CXXC-type zinc finger protein 1-like n=1 Tax=Macaca thibetana thibetana TaxID=257877 RepID=UPI0021BCA389|nr:CXXC-type zinc finger protein 1-like [Macaca thibetana thibetana]
MCEVHRARRAEAGSECEAQEEFEEKGRAEGDELNGEHEGRLGVECRAGVQELGVNIDPPNPAMTTLVLKKEKQQTQKRKHTNNEGEKGSKDLQIFCVSCGQPISKRVALRHMERCFAKYECQLSIGSLYPTCIEGTTWFFCDAYSLKSKRYCKRLKVLCSEHSWDPKVPKDEVGGCPLVHNVFEFTGNFCCLPKCLRNCYYSWEKLRRAEVDLERVQALHKLEQLFEQEQKVHTFLMNRVGLLALMLHKTIQHDPFTSDLCSRVDI